MDKFLIAFIFGLPVINGLDARFYFCSTDYFFGLNVRPVMLVLSVIKIIVWLFLIQGNVCAKIILNVRITVILSSFYVQAFIFSFIYYDFIVGKFIVSSWNLTAIK